MAEINLENYKIIEESGNLILRHKSTNEEIKLESTGETTTKMLNTEEASITEKWNFETNTDIDTQKVIETGNYSAEPFLTRAQNGDILLLYREGSSHVSDDGELKLIRSIDNGKTWSSPEVIQDDASYDDRNQVIFTEEETGRIGIFFRKYDASGSSTIGEFYMYSDDNGETWTTPTDISSELSYGKITYVKPVKTSNGLMALFDDFNGAGEAIFSTDNAQTWGSSVTMFTGESTPNELNPIRYSDDNILVVGRDTDGVGDASNSKMYLKTTDGGSSWTSVSYFDLGDFSGHGFRGGKYGHKLILLSCDRWQKRIFKIEANAQDIWENPDQLKNLKIKDIRICKNTGGGIGDYGYPSLLKTGTDSYLASWYEYGGSADDVNVWVGTIEETNTQESMIPSDISGSRSLDYWYYNKKDYPIFLRVYIKVSGAGNNSRIKFHLNDEKTDNGVGVAGTVSSDALIVYAQGSIIVPSGHYYKVEELKTDGSLDQWYETELQQFID